MRPNIIISLGQWMAVLGLLTFTFIITLALLPWPRLVFKLERWMADMALKIFQIEVVVKDENNGAYTQANNIFVTLNHTSLMEVFIGIRAIPRDCKVLTNIEFALVPILGWYTVVLGGPVLIRQWKAQTLRSLEKAVQQLKKNNLWMSIEGLFSRNGKLNPYKKGPSLLALQAQATLVPVIFQGARDRLAYGKWRVTPGIVTVILAEKIITTNLTLEDRDSLTIQMRKTAEEKCEQIRITGPSSQNEK